MDWQQRHCRVHQIFNALTVNRADGKYFVETELGKFIGAGLGAMRVHFVDGNQNRFSAAAQFFRDFEVERHNAFLHVDDENDDVCGFNGQIHLFHRRLDDDIIGFFTAQQADATGVHQRKGSSVPFRFGNDSVARHARLIVDNGDAPSNNAIEQRGLADIGATDNGNQV